MVQRNSRNFGPPNLFGRGQTSMAGDHVAVPINQDRNVKAERLNALGDLPDLLLALLACVAGVWPQVIDWSVLDRKRRAAFRVWFGCWRTLSHGTSLDARLAEMAGLIRR
jgi:hypothetical protein